MEASQVDAALNDEEQGIVRTAMMGGTMAKQEIAKLNEDYDEECSYCQEATSTATHIRWYCKHFESQRCEVDPALAAVPRKYLLECIKCGVAPAMKILGEKPIGGGR